MRRFLSIVLALAVPMALAAIADGKPKKPQNGFTTWNPKNYAPGLNGWQTRVLLSVNDVVDETGNATGKYRMVGIPDGLGVLRRGKSVRVFMNHEMTKTDASEPRVGRPRQRGAFVSEWTLDKRGNVKSGRRAFDTVYQDNTLVGPAADESNTTPAFSRFCSAFLAGRGVGFDRPIFFANEETGPSAPAPTASFDGKGSQAVAIFDQQAHALSKLGRFPRENTLVMRGTGKRTVIVMTEDGPRTPDSQLYLYIGRKDRSSHNALRRNGLDNGKLYVFASDDARDDENQLLQGDSVHGTWKEIPGADQMTDVQLEAASDAVGAFGFVRIEDGEFRPNAKREFWFDTTGDQQDRDEADPHTNELGRLYRLRFDTMKPLAGANLTQAYNADQLTPAQDGPLSPDNVTVTKRHILVNEDGTAGAAPPGTGTGSRDDMDRRNRDGSIWLVPLRSAGNPATFTRVAELIGRAQGGWDNIPTVDSRGNRAGVWETSGIVGSRHAFGKNTFVFDVQAHPPTTAPGGQPLTVEDGQFLMLKR
jgi:hypothetical protein